MKFETVKDFESFIIKNFDENISDFVIEEFNQIVPELDSENISWEELAWSTMDFGKKQYYGGHELDNHYIFGFNMGGDWQNPLFGIIYQKKSGGLLEFYFPRKGNPFREDLGVVMPYDEDSVTEEEKYKINHDLIIEDIKEYLTKV